MMIDEICREVSMLPKSPKGKVRRVPDSLRAEIIKAMGTEGYSVKQMAGVVGVHISTIHQWLSAKGRRKEKFKELKVGAEVGDVTFVVEGPLGLRLSGVTLKGLVELLREAGR